MHLWWRCCSCCRLTGKNHSIPFWPFFAPSIAPNVAIDMQEHFGAEWRFWLWQSLQRPSTTTCAQACSKEWIRPSCLSVCMPACLPAYHCTVTGSTLLVLKCLLLLHYFTEGSLTMKGYFHFADLEKAQRSVLDWSTPSTLMHTLVFHLLTPPPTNTAHKLHPKPWNTKKLFQWMFCIGYRQTWCGYDRCHIWHVNTKIK